MYKKTAERFIFEGLRYFFYLDYNYCCYLYLLLLMIPFFVKLFLHKIDGGLHDSLIALQTLANTVNSIIMAIMAYLRTTYTHIRTSHLSSWRDALYKTGFRV